MLTSLGSSPVAHLTSDRTQLTRVDPFFPSTSIFPLCACLVFGAVHSSVLSDVLQLAIVIEWLTILGIYNIYFHPLSRFLGLKLWAAYRLTYAISLQRGNLHTRLREFHDRNGSMVRIAPNELSLTDPQALKDIYGTRSSHLPFERNRTCFPAAKPGDPESIDHGT